ncbi:hypothetical protein [Hymenobacter cellulosilyticus]|uniref:Lipoprotein n=1 Tax=Hymenobacter cellulosilyticus TaxID=2932248 RepID=A0A8T9QE04_9BACT|nr:hypothetical protein [Hymenobacter cellulosilyticus]UOQ73043.1 hypothetical protein MUN79_03440 [Hymenobacter cellulosilyticus]
MKYHLRGYCHYFWTGVISLTLAGCGKDSYHAAKARMRTPMPSHSKHFRNAPRQEYVVLDDACSCRRKLFRQFAAQYRALMPGPPFKKPFVSALDVQPLFAPAGCDGLYYFYHTQLHNVKWRGNPVFPHPVFIISGDSLHLLTADTLRNQRLLESFRGQPLYDSLVKRRPIISQGKVFVEH